MDIKKLADRIHSRDLTDLSVLSGYFESLRLLERRTFPTAHRCNAYTQKTEKVKIALASIPIIRYNISV